MHPKIPARTVTSPVCAQKDSTNAERFRAAAGSVSLWIILAVLPVRALLQAPPIKPLIDLGQLAGAR
jgi:hypothetical protein